MKKLLGLDIGQRRTGVAVSDELGLTARPLETISSRGLPSRLSALLAEHQINTVVVGRPRHLDGSLGPQAKLIDVMVDQLKGIVPATFVYEDETGTTAEAEAAGGSDAEAACVMLQGYLNEYRHD